MILRGRGPSTADVASSVNIVFYLIRTLSNMHILSYTMQKHDYI